MRETTTIKGTWWLPENPDRKLVGEITYGPVDGAELDLLEYFYEQHTTERFTVWGMTLKGKKITLFDCFTRNVTMHMPGGRQARITSSFGIVGGHCNTIDDMAFREVTAEISHLFEWAWITGIKVEPFQQQDKRLHISQARSQDVFLGTHNGLPANLEFSSTFSPGYGHVEMTEYCHLRINANELRPFDSFDEVFHRVQHFVALGVGQPIYALSVKAYDDTVENVDRQTYEIIRRVDVKSTEEKLMPHFMPFALPDLQPSPNIYSQRFFDKYERLKPVCDLYFSTVYHSDMFIRQKFLALAHAVEAYHRVFLGGQYQSAEEFESGLLQSLYAAIPDGIEKDFRASLKTKMKYLHEYSLRKRIQDICEQFVDLLEPWLGKPKDFASATSELRNNLTHAKVEINDGCKTNEFRDLWMKSEQLSLLLEVCLMHQIGFSDDKTKELLPRNKRPQRIQLNRK